MSGDTCKVYAAQNRQSVYHVNQPTTKSGRDPTFCWINPYIIMLSENRLYFIKLYFYHIYTYYLSHIVNNLCNVSALLRIRISITIGSHIYIRFLFDCRRCAVAILLIFRAAQSAVAKASDSDSMSMLIQRWVISGRRYLIHHKWKLFNISIINKEKSYK